MDFQACCDEILSVLWVIFERAGAGGWSVLENKIERALGVGGARWMEWEEVVG